MGKLKTTNLVSRASLTAKRRKLRALITTNTVKTTIISWISMRKMS